MSRICQICGKSYSVGNLVPRGVGNRVTRRTSIRKKANLRVKRFEIDGKALKVTLCASCLKRINKDIKDYNNQSAVSSEAKTEVASN